MSFVSLLLIKFLKAVKRSNQLRTLFLIVVHRTRGDTKFLKFLLIQLY